MENFFDDLEEFNADTVKPNTTVTNTPAFTTASDMDIPSDIEVSAKENTEDTTLIECDEKIEPIKKVAKTSTKKDSYNKEETHIGSAVIIDGNFKNTGDTFIAGSINGAEVNITGNVVVMGSGIVNGNLSVNGSIEVLGSVNGEVDANSIVIEGRGKVRGNITVRSEAPVQIKDKECVVIGDVSGDDIIVNGAVKGNITARSEVKISKSGIIKGSVTAKALVIDEGATLDGACTLLSKDCDYKAIFGE